MEAFRGLVGQSWLTSPRALISYETHHCLNTEAMDKSAIVHVRLS